MCVIYSERLGAPLQRPTHPTQSVSKLLPIDRFFFLFFFLFFRSTCPVSRTAVSDVLATGGFRWEGVGSGAQPFHPP